MAALRGGGEEALDQVRRRFEDGEPVDVRDPAAVVLRSWQRSQRLGRRFRDKVIFNPVVASARRQLEEKHHHVLSVAAPQLANLIGMLDRDEWAVSFVDTDGFVVHTLRAEHPRFEGLVAAFRPGVNLGEASAGTTGPACALAEARTVVVSGKEHFLDEAAAFTCSSAPVFDAAGNIAGVINASRRYIGPQSGVPLAVSAAAYAIEARLIESLPGSLCLRLALAGGLDAGMQAVLAFSQEGVLLGASRDARRLLGIGAGYAPRFDELFDLGFGAAMDRLSAAQTSSVDLPTVAGQYLSASRVARAAPRGVAPRASDVVEAPRCELLPPALQAKAASMLRAFSKDVPVLLSGPTGSGKEMLARWLHARGPRAAGPFVAINCSAVPATLIESELFGFEAGAFTGAAREGAIGKLRQADGGTLFLDEIGDMPLAMQARLLRVLQERKVCPVGGRKEYAVDFSLLSATHQDLAGMVARGEFRQDLYYRVNGLRFALPALAARADFDHVVRRLLVQIAAEGAAATIEPEALATLRRAPWHGNIRELESVLRVAAALSADGCIRRSHLPADLAACDDPDAHITGALEKAEARVIREAMEAHHGCVASVARALSLSRATLYKKLRLYRIDKRVEGEG